MHIPINPELYYIIQNNIPLTFLFYFSSSADKKEKGMGGIGGKMSPSAVIVIQGGKTKLVNVKNQDTITKILDMVPDVVDRFTGKDERMTEKEVNDILDAEIEK